MTKKEISDLLGKSMEALLAEKEAERAFFREKVEKLPLKERQKKGFSWYPLEFSQKGYTIGERSFVVFNRTNHIDEPHQFRSGNTVRIFSTLSEGGRKEVYGVIHYVHKNKMKVILSTKDYPDWLDKGLCALDLGFEERSYLEMEKALASVQKASKDRLAELRDRLLGQIQDAEYLRSTTPFDSNRLNVEQNKAVYQILQNRAVEIIHGPPGTGKTTTLVAAIKALSAYNSQILVCAPSNTAVDLLTERLHLAGLRALRIGNISRVDESLLQHTLEAQIASHPESKNIKKVRKDAAEARRKAKKYKRKFDREAYQDRKNHYQEARELEDWAKQLEHRVIDQIIHSSQVICCTLVGSNDRVLANRKFPIAIIDEAAQALMPACWIPIVKSSRVVLAGDPFQLPPTVKSTKARQLKFEISLLEHALQHMPYNNFLTTQYRMHKDIMAFPNEVFYQNRLRAAPEIAERKLNILSNQQVQFIDTAGCGFEEKTNSNSLSKRNPDEYLIIREHLLQLLQECIEGKEMPSIAIISPYKDQVRWIASELKAESTLDEFGIESSTIDGFQGQERDVIYISLVRSNGKGEIGFLKDYRRMNVAMSRARKLLVVVGDSSTVGKDKFYSQFLDFADKLQAYKTAWEYMK